MALKQLDADAFKVIYKRKIGFIFQSLNFLPRLSARKDVSLSLLYAGIS